MSLLNKHKGSYGHDTSSIVVCPLVQFHILSLTVFAFLYFS